MEEFGEVDGEGDDAVACEVRRCAQNAAVDDGVLEGWLHLWVPLVLLRCCAVAAWRAGGEALGHALLPPATSRARVDRDDWLACGVAQPGLPSWLLAFGALNPSRLRRAHVADAPRHAAAGARHCAARRRAPWCEGDEGVRPPPTSLHHVVELVGHRVRSHIGVERQQVGHDDDLRLQLCFDLDATGEHAHELPVDAALEHTLEEGQVEVRLEGVLAVVERHGLVTAQVPYPASRLGLEGVLAQREGLGSLRVDALCHCLAVPFADLFELLLDALDRPCLQHIVDALGREAFGQGRLLCWGLERLCRDHWCAVRERRRAQLWRVELLTRSSQLHRQLLQGWRCDALRPLGEAFADVAFCAFRLLQQLPPQALQRLVAAPDACVEIGRSCD